MLYKARTGVLRENLPERVGLWKGTHSRYKTWRTCGVWDEVMAALPGAGSPVWTTLPLVPPLRAEGRVDPRVLADPIAEEETASAGTGVRAPPTHRTSAGFDVRPFSITFGGPPKRQQSRYQVANGKCATKSGAPGRA
ncbi:hypothetical protein ACFWOJ_03635 [Streptomyces sp. NPDC058439]|uniref:hypothetical protein n=1 Tax=Streptomyces sp. NPDC058439 TaxID=3346500 RepID=UPI0036653D2E